MRPGVGRESRCSIVATSCMHTRTQRATGVVVVRARPLTAPHLLPSLSPTTLLKGEARLLAGGRHLTHLVAQLVIHGLGEEDDALAVEAVPDVHPLRMRVARGGAQG